MANDRLIAYFSMEIAIRPEMPTYSGGLGILAVIAFGTSAPEMAVSTSSSQADFWSTLRF